MRMFTLLVFLVSIVASLRANLAFAESLPTPMLNADGMASVECSVNDQNCLRKTNAGLLLPYFGTETKVIFSNSGSNDVNINLMVGTNPNVVMTVSNNRIVDDRFAWFILVTNRVNDVGRFSHASDLGGRTVPTVDIDLPKIVMERMAGGQGDIRVPVPGNGVLAIFGMWETIWTTLRLPVPKGYSVWMVPVRMKPNQGYKVAKGDPLNNRVRQEDCPAEESVGSMWVCADDKYHFRYWLLSIDDKL